MNSQTIQITSIPFGELKPNDKELLKNLADPSFNPTFGWLGVSTFTGGRFIRLSPKNIMANVEGFMSEMLSIGFSLPFIKIVGAAAKQDIKYIISDC